MPIAMGNISITVTLIRRHNEGCCRHLTQPAAPPIVIRIEQLVWLRSRIEWPFHRESVTPPPSATPSRSMKLYLHLQPSGELREWTFVCKAPLHHVHEAVAAFADAYNRKFTARLAPTSLVVTRPNSTRPVDPAKKISTLVDDSDSCELTLTHVPPPPAPAPGPRSPAATPGGTDVILAHATKHKQNKAWRSAKALWEAVLADMDPTNVPAMRGLVDLYVQSSQWSHAKKWISNVLPHVDAATKSALRLEMAKCEVRVAKFGRAVSILQELLADPHLLHGIHHDASILLADALYHGGAVPDQEAAISLLVGILHKSNDSDLDAIALYSEIAHDRGKAAEAVQMILKVLVGRPQDKRVQALCASFLNEPNGFTYLQQALDPTSPSTAPAYAYLASVSKDHGAMAACVQCFEQAVAQCPHDVMFALNYVHALEVCGRYADAYAFIMSFLETNSTLVVGDGLACSDVARVLASFATLDDARGPWRADAAVTWKATHLCVDENDAKFQGRVAEAVDLTSEQLDLLALLCTLVKILFLQGCLQPLPDLLEVIEPVRYHYGHLLHTTSIRNEHAYYSCISQLVAIAPLAPSFPPPSNPIYVCGDSHTLAAAWRSVKVHATDRVLVPALVTGLKHWHLRKDTNFYPKVNFFNVVNAIPRGATVVFIFGEIDCREGLLVAVEKCRYESLADGMAHTISIFMDVLEGLVRQRGFYALIHPVVPVLKETRQIVRQYNRVFHEKVKASGFCQWMDIFDGLLTSNNLLHDAYELDGTHLHPSYLRLWTDALEAHIPQPNVKHR